MGTYWGITRDHLASTIDWESVDWESVDWESVDEDDYLHALD